MDAEIKLTLAKIPVVLVCLAALFIDFSDGEERQDLARYYSFLGLHLLVFLDLLWRNITFSRCYYSVLTLYMIWGAFPDTSKGEAALKFQLLGGLIWLTPYLLVTTLAWLHEQKTDAKIRE